MKPWLWLSGLVACIVGGFVLWAMAARTFAPKEALFEQITMQAVENRVTAAALSPNGEELAFGTFGGPTYVRRMSDGFTRRVTTPRGLEVERLAWFADSSRLLASGTIDHRAGVWVMPLNGGAPSLIGPEGRDGVPSGWNANRLDQCRRRDNLGHRSKWRVFGRFRTVAVLAGFRPCAGRRMASTRTASGICAAEGPDGTRTTIRNYAYAYEATDVNTGRGSSSLRGVLITSAFGLVDGRRYRTLDGSQSRSTPALGNAHGSENREFSGRLIK